MSIPSLFTDMGSPDSHVGENRPAPKVGVVLTQLNGRGGQIITAEDARACITRKFGSGGGQYAVLFEVRNGTGFRGNRSVDAVVMSLWPSLGLELWGVEIKTSRSDWLRELKKPDKASMVFDYFDRWLLVAPADVVRSDELPPPWGWYVPENGSLTCAVQAPKNANVKPVDRDFLAALLRRVTVTDNGVAHKMVESALAEQRQRIEADALQKSIKELGELRHAAEDFVKLRDLLKDKPTDFIFTEEVIGALKLVMKLGIGGTYNSVRGMIETVARVNAEFQKIDPAILGDGKK